MSRLHQATGHGAAHPAKSDHADPHRLHSQKGFLAIDGAGPPNRALSETQAIALEQNAALPGESGEQLVERFCELPTPSSTNWRVM